MSEWRPITTAPLDTVVQTKIHDAGGERNHAQLKQSRREGGYRSLWWTADGAMYVYYTPTHWRPA